MLSKGSADAPGVSGVDVGGALQRISVGLLAIIMLACMHVVCYNLHYILAPFVFSGIVVFALEPTVQRLYNSIAGLAPPYRWCCCCTHRKWKSRRLSDESATPREESDEGSDAELQRRSESQMLLGDDGAIDWEGYGITILDVLCRILAVTVVLGGVVVIASFLLWWLVDGALEIKDHWRAYQKGADDWILYLDHVQHKLAQQSSAFNFLNLDGATQPSKGKQNHPTSHAELQRQMDARLRMLYTNLFSRFQGLLLQLVDILVGFVGGGVSFTVMVILYMIFWLFHPLPIGTKAATLVKSYMWKKTIVGVVYGICVFILLWSLGVDIPIFFGLVSFFLTFVPEVGPLISMLAPIPLILLNANLESPGRTFVVSFVGQILIKLFIGNSLELKLISDDDEMSLHPVWVLLSLNYFGLLWGPVGMLVSVPILALIKSVAISNEEEYRHRQPFLSEFAGELSACLEGRKRHNERRRSTWILPFSRPSKLKNDEVSKEGDIKSDSEASKADGDSPQPATVGPKKPRT